MKRDTPKRHTLEGFAAWLGTKPPRERYEFIDNENCAISQYVKSFGVTNVSAGPTSYYYRDKRGRAHSLTLDYRINVASRGCQSNRSNQTFGAAHKRALKALEKTAHGDCCAGG